MLCNGLKFNNEQKESFLYEIRNKLKVENIK